MPKKTPTIKPCKGFEVVCPDGLVRYWPYHSMGDAGQHARSASDLAWFRIHGCRPAPKASALERSLPPCPGGKHRVRATTILDGDATKSPRRS